MLKKILSWTRRYKVEFGLLVLVLLVGGFLRFYQVGEWMHFGQDEGRDAFIIESIVADGDIQLLGPAAPNNSPNFHLGPAFYYLLVPFYWLSGYSPAGGAFAIALLSFLSIFLIYIVGRIFFSWRAGLIAAGFYSVSFMMVYYGRWAWNPNVVPFFVLLIFLSLYKLTKLKNNKKNENYLFLLAAAVGLIIQMHGTALIVMPVILLLFFIIYWPKISWKKYLLAVVILLIFNAPYVIHDLTNSFANTAGFFTVIGQSESGQTAGWFTQVKAAYQAWESFWHEALLHKQSGFLFFILFASSVIYLILRFIFNVKWIKTRPAVLLICLWFIVPLLIFTFYKEAIPPHYFVLIFPLPFLVLAWVLDYFWRKSVAKVIIILIVLGLFGWQLVYSIQLLDDLSPDGLRTSSYPVTLVEMESVVEYIIEDSQKKPFNFVADNYYRSFEYLFDQQGLSVSVAPELLRYEVVVGGDQGERFGNLSVLRGIDN